MKLTKQIILHIVMAGLTVLLVGAASARSQDVVDRVVAVVNGELITLFELNQRFRLFLDQFEGRELLEEEKRELWQVKRQLLDRMVDETLLRQEAERLEIRVSDLDVQNQVRHIRERTGMTETELMNQLRREGLSRETYEQRMREEIKRQRLTGMMVRRKIVVTSEEIRQYYEEQQQEFHQQRRVHLGLILFASPEQAEEALSRMQAGELSFADAARAYSQGPGADQGGDIGRPAWRDLAEEWRNALTGLAVGQTSGLFFVQGRPALLKLLDEDPGEVQSLAEVEDLIRERLMEPRLEQRFDEYMTGLRGRALIDIRL